MSRIIPAIDIINGKCVRLSKGDYNTSKTYFDQPLDAALQFQDAGLRYIHIVDLDGAKSKKIQNLKVLETIANQTNLTIDFGGGVKSKSDLESALNAGATQVTCGSIAVQSPLEVADWIKTYGSEKIILGADAKNGLIATNGWMESSNLELNQFLKDWIEKGIQYTVCTDISKDGMLEGPNFALYKQIKQQMPQLKTIASGGISCLEDVTQLLSDQTVDGIIIGKAIYEGRIQLKDLSKLC